MVAAGDLNVEHGEPAGFATTGSWMSVSSCTRSALARHVESAAIAGVAAAAAAAIVPAIVSPAMKRFLRMSSPCRSDVEGSSIGRASPPVAPRAGEPLPPRPAPRTGEPLIGARRLEAMLTSRRPWPQG